MLIPFNSPCAESAHLDFPWQEDEDMNNRSYWPGWSVPIKTGQEEWDISFWFIVDLEDGSINSFTIESPHFSRNVADPPDSLTYHRTTFDTGEFEEYMTITDIMKTIQANFWGFRYVYWSMQAREGLYYLAMDSKTE